MSAKKAFVSQFLGEKTKRELLSSSHFWILLAVLSLGLFFAAWSFVPVFDLDEALYRRMAEEMKMGSSYWVPHWDAFPMHDKPPLYVWLIVWSSWLLGEWGAEVSVFAARLPSFLSFVLTCCLLGWKPYQNALRPNDVTFLRCAVGSFCTGLGFYGLFWFPLLAAFVCLIDPPLVLCFLASFILINKHFFDTHNNIYRLSDRAFWCLKLGVVLALATCLKGLIGTVIPSFAMAIFLLLLLMLRRPWPWVRVVDFALAILLANLLAAIYYLIIYQQPGGQTYLRDFFLVHHFGRGAKAMEGHSGSFFYHFFIVYFGGGLGLCALLKFMAEKSSFTKISAVPVALLWGLCWVLAFLVFFGVVATKLPNYSWPVWPILCLLLLPILAATNYPLKGFTLKESAPLNASCNASNPPSFKVRRRLSVALDWISSCPIFFISAGLFCIALGGFVTFSEQAKILWPGFYLPTVAQKWAGFDQRALAVLQVLKAPGWFFWAVLLIFSLVLWLLARQAQRLRAGDFTDPVLRFRSISLLLFSSSCLIFASLPSLRDNYSTPLSQVSHLLREKNLASTQVAAIGLRSPALSSAFGNLGLRQFHKGDVSPFLNSHFQAIVLPVWLEQKCAENHWSAESRFALWVVCFRQEPLKN